MKIFCFYLLFQKWLKYVGKDIYIYIFFFQARPRYSSDRENLFHETSALVIPPPSKYHLIFLYHTSETLKTNTWSGFRIANSNTYRLPFTRIIDWFSIDTPRVSQCQISLSLTRQLYRRSFNYFAIVCPGFLDRGRFWNEDQVSSRQAGPRVE